MGRVVGPCRRDACCLGIIDGGGKHRFSVSHAALDASLSGVGDALRAGSHVSRHEGGHGGNRLDSGLQPLLEIFVLYPQIDRDHDDVFDEIDEHGRCSSKIGTNRPAGSAPRSLDDNGSTRSNVRTTDVNGHTPCPDPKNTAAVRWPDPCKL